MSDTKLLTAWEARSLLKSYGLSVFSSSAGALVFRYPDQVERRIYPVWVSGAGWFYPKSELMPQYEQAN